MSHPDTWTVHPADRIRDLEGSDLFIGPEDTFSYSIRHGYEKLEVSYGGGGSMSYVGSLHPGDGFCHSKPDVADASDGICVHCGRTLM